jgi:hypothetical protein
MNAEKRRAVAYHEAGHAMAAWKFKLGGIGQTTIVPTADYSGAMKHAADPLRGIRLDLDNSDRAHARAEKLIMICQAGPIAQRRGAPRSWRYYHGSGDRRIAADLAIRLQSSAEIATAYIRYLDLRTKGLVHTHWWAVDLIARALLERDTLTGEEIAAMIAAHLTSRPAPYKIESEAGPAKTFEVKEPG